MKRKIPHQLVDGHHPHQSLFLFMFFLKRKIFKKIKGKEKARFSTMMMVIENPSPWSMTFRVVIWWRPYLVHFEITLESMKYIQSRLDRCVNDTYWIEKNVLLLVFFVVQRKKNSESESHWMMDQKKKSNRNKKSKT